MSETTDNASPYTITRVIKEVTLGSEHNPSSTLSVILQRRRRDDGKMSREFVSIKFDVGKKVFFFSVPSATDLAGGLGLVLPEAQAEEDRMHQEWEARRSRWESQNREPSNCQINTPDNPDNKRRERSERHSKNRTKNEE